MLSLPGILSDNSNSSPPIIVDSYDNAVLFDSPLVYLKLNDASKTGQAVDFSGNNNHGTYYIESVGNYPVAAAALRDGSTGSTFLNYYPSLGFSNMVRIPKANLNLLGDWSVELWFKVQNRTYIAGICGESYGNGDTVSQFQINQGAIGGGASTKISVNSYKNGFSTPAIANAIMANNAIYHICGVKESNTLKLYINGVLQTIQGAAIASASDTDGYIYLNRHSDLSLSNPMQATYSDFAIYNYALSAAQISTHYSWG